MRPTHVKTTQEPAKLHELLTKIEAEFSRTSPEKWEMIAALCDQAEPLATALGDEQSIYLLRLRRASCLRSAHDYPAALALARTCIDYFAERNTLYWLQALQPAGNAVWNLGDYSAALDYFETSLRLSRELGLEHDESMALTNIGAAQSRLGKYELAIESYTASLELKNKLHDIKGVAVVLGNLGNVYQYQHNYEAAAEYYQQSMTRAHEVKDSAHIARMLNNLGAMHYVQQSYPQALEYFLQALNLLRDEFDSDAHPSIPTLLGHIGEVYHFLEQYNVAAGYMSQALEAVIKQGNQSRLHTILSGLGGLYANEKYREFSLPKAKEYIRQALEIAREINERPVFANYSNKLAQIEYQLGNYAEAYAYLQNSIAYATDLHSEELDEKLRAMHVQHQVEQLKKEAEIARLKNTVLEVSNKHLEELNAIKNTFLGIAAHDLKNPLSSIKMLARMLEEYADVMSVEEVRNSARDIGVSSAQMFDLIVSLLDINALEQGKVNLSMQVVEVGELVRRTAEGYRARAEKKGIELIIDVRQNYALIDSTKFIQITENLISNAIKFSPHHRKIYITIGSVVQGMVRLSVRDEGEGIAPEEMHKLFAKFERLQAQPTGGEHSTGLGLSIVKQLAELMNGRVWCESVYGEGATFSAEFPEYDLTQE